MEELYYSTMSPSRIMRKSIFTFLKNFHHLFSAPSLLLLPFAAATLLSPPLIASSYLFPLVYGRLRSLFLAAGIPPQSELFAILNLKLSQTLLSFIFLLPFSLSFLLLSKAAIIKLLHHEKNYKPFSWILTLNRLISTQICSSLVILSANATCFSLVAVAFNFSDMLGFRSPRFRLLLSAIGAIVYSIVLANAYVICGLSVIMSAAEGCGGFSSILKACVAVRGRTAVALSLAVPMNMALAAVEALFQYRLVGAYNRGMAVDSAVVLEAVVVAYMYAVVVVIDTVVGYMLLRSCREDYKIPLRFESFKEGKVLDSAL